MRCRRPTRAARRRTKDVSDSAATSFSGDARHVDIQNNSFQKALGDAIILPMPVGFSRRLPGIIGDIDLNDWCSE
jgi:hypothetical protein